MTTIPYFQEGEDIVAIVVHPSIGVAFTRCKGGSFRTHPDGSWEGIVKWVALLPPSSPYGEKDGKLVSSLSFDEGVSFIKDNYPPDWYPIRHVALFTEAALRQRYEKWVEEEASFLESTLRANALKAGFEETSLGTFKLPGFPWKLGLFDISPRLAYTRYLVTSEANYNRQAILALYDFNKAATRIRKVAASAYGQVEAKYLNSPTWVWDGKIYLGRGVVNIDDMTPC